MEDKIFENPIFQDLSLDELLSKCLQDRHKIAIRQSTILFGNYVLKIFMQAEVEIMLKLC